MPDVFMCSVYRSPRKEGMYLYVAKDELFTRVPEPLLDQFGAPTHVMDLQLKPERKLARGNAREVMAAIREQGFYLQLPPESSFFPAIEIASSR